MKINWPFAVEVGTFLAAIGALWYAKRADRSSARSTKAAEEGLELARAAWLASPGADTLSPRELFVLSEIDKGGGRLCRGHIQSHPNGPAVYLCDRIETSGRLVAGREKNPDYFEIVQNLITKGCLEPQGGNSYRVSDKARGILRRDEKADREPVKMEPPF